MWKTWLIRVGALAVVLIVVGAWASSLVERGDDEPEQTPVVRRDAPDRPDKGDRDRRTKQGDRRAEVDRPSDDTTRDPVEVDEDADQVDSPAEDPADSPDPAAPSNPDSPDEPDGPGQGDPPDPPSPDPSDPPPAADNCEDLGDAVDCILNPVTSAP